jgi:hypothetical protein
MQQRILRIRLGNYGDPTAATLAGVRFESVVLVHNTRILTYRIDDHVAGQSIACVVSESLYLNISDAIVGSISVGQAARTCACENADKQKSEPPKN